MECKIVFRVFSADRRNRLFLYQYGNEHHFVVAYTLANGLHEERNYETYNHACWQFNNVYEKFKKQFDKIVKTGF